MALTCVNTWPLAMIARRGTIVALALFAIAAVLLCATLATLASPTHPLVWGSLALAAYAVGFLFLVGDRQGRALGLISWWFGAWILAFWSVSFGFATVTWSRSQAPTAARQIVLPTILGTLCLVAVGMTAWVLGCLVGPVRPLRGTATRRVGALRLLAGIPSTLLIWVLAIAFTCRPRRSA